MEVSTFAARSERKLRAELYRHSQNKWPEDYAREVSGDGNCNSRTDMEAHTPPPRNKRVAVAALNKQAAAVVERHTPLAVRVRFLR